MVTLLSLAVSVGKGVCNTRIVSPSLKGKRVTLKVVRDSPKPTAGNTSSTLINGRGKASDLDKDL